jgi:nitronate monooxygenase
MSDYRGYDKQNALLNLLGIKKPIIQAPMAGVNTPALTAAVSNAGGLGSYGVGAMNSDAARKTIREIRALTEKPFNINVFCHQPATANETVEHLWLEWLAPHFAQFGAKPPEVLKEIYTSFIVDEAMATMLIEERPAVVSFHFGLPEPNVIAALKAAGIRLLATATNVNEAQQAVSAGVDAIVAQGIEAGGHRGAFDPQRDDELGTVALTRLLASKFELPIIAAGGIMDGSGIAAVFALGAAAAQLGTAFVACPETSMDDGYRRALLSDAAYRTTLTDAISGRAARGIANKFTQLGADSAAPTRPDYPIAYDAGKALHAAAKAQGEFGYGAQWAGQGAALARALPAADLVALLEAELKACARVLAERCAT